MSVAGGVGPSSRAGSVHARVAAAGAANQIGAVGAAALAEGVKASGTLKTLGLDSECSITFCRTYVQNLMCSVFRADNVIGDAGKRSLVDMLKLNFVLRVMVGIDCGTELACHYRVPHVRCIVRTRVMCQAGRARAAGAHAATSWHGCASARRSGSSCTRARFW